MNLSCSADGFPAPVITWTFQAMLFTNETVNSSNSTYTESTIVITNLLLSHRGSYSCQIDSDAVIMPTSSEASVTVIGSKFNSNIIYIRHCYSMPCDSLHVVVVKLYIRTAIVV